MQKIKEKRKFKSIWQRQKTPTNKRRLNAITKEVKHLIQTHCNEEFHTYITNLSPYEGTNYSLWKATKRLKRPTIPAHAIKKSDSNWAKSPTEKATVFAEYLQNIFKPNITNFTDAPTDHSLRIANETDPIENIPPTSIKEVTKLIFETRNNKSPGFDLIGGKILKELPPKVIRLLTIIFNAVLRIKFFPTSWKIAQVIMLLKPKKDPHLPASYRPISLLPSMSKLLGKIILIRMKKIISEKNLIPSHQFGFRNKYATTEQIHRMTNSITAALERKEYCTALFLDVEKAFDKVWHKGLLAKIKEAFPLPYYQLLKSYLEDRTFFVKVQESYSEVCSIEAGVPQGSVLGPVLYTLFTADIPTTSETKSFTFADDTAIVAVHTDPTKAHSILQQHLLKIEQWLNRWKIKVNSDKCKHITFTLRKGSVPSITLNRTIIPQTKTVRYLGMHLDSRMTWKHHIKTKIEQIRQKRRDMYWLTCKNSRLNMNNKLLIYKSIIKPIWTYGIEIWGTAAKSHISKLEALQSIILRTIVNAPWYMRNDQLRKDLKINSVEEEIIRLSNRYKSRLENHPSEPAKKLYSENLPRRLRRKHPNDLLHTT
ncbi:Probable RNA-directed DNA polymerase from transposon X-element [Anthophora retusa]